MASLDARALAIFDAIADLPPDQRAAELIRLCADDAALRAAVERMLTADAGEDGVLGVAPQALLDDGADDAHDPLLGQTLGAWRIERVIGRGGMGAVYLGQRDHGDFEQTAAIKLIRMGMDDGRARERFLRERQILARLQHRHIATLLDGGVSAAGAPWFAMEHIDGERIDTWCDARCLSVRERVRLFLQVLDAVAYAHRNLVIHRDIKPVNVLVDAQGQSRLLDFGIARLLEDADGAQTATRERAMTPEYASPEQLHGLPVTTATDIYQLGLMLHTLLTGMHPFGITGQTPLAQQLQSLERAPASLADAALHATAALVQARATDRTTLRRQLQGDLTAIVGHCLAREPERRYGSVDALASDLKAWLDGAPISVRADSRSYRLRRFVRRNRVAVGAAAAVIVALVVGLGAALWQAHEATRSRAQAEVVNGYLSDIFASIDPEDAQGPDVRVMPLVDEGVRRLDAGQLRGQPVAEARLRGTLADAYTGLGRYDRAMAQLDKALMLASGDAALRWKLGLRQLELMAIRNDDTHARPRLEALRRTLPDAGKDMASNRLLLDEQEIRLLEQEGRSADALSLAGDAFHRARQHDGADSDMARSLQAMYVHRLRDAGDNDEAIRLQEDLLKRTRARHDVSPVALSSVLHNLAYLLDVSDPQRAIALEQEALQIRKRDLPPTHPYLISSLGTLAYLQKGAGEHEAAYATLRDAVQRLRASASPDLDGLATLLNNWGWTCYSADDLVCANDKVGEAVALWTRVHPPHHADLLTARVNLAVLRTELGRLAEGERLFQEVIATLRTALRNDDTPARRAGLAATLVKFGGNQIAQAHWTQAQAAGREAGAIAATAGAAGQDERLSANAVLARALAWGDACAQAVPLAQQLQRDAEKEKSPRRVIDAQLVLGLCWGRDAATAARAIDVLKRARAAIENDALKAARADALLAVALHNAGNNSEARKIAGRALPVLEQRAAWLQETRLARKIRTR